MSSTDITIDRVNANAPRRGSDYAELMRLVRAAGLLRRRPAFYAAHLAAVAVMLAVGWTLFARLGNSWWQVVTAAALALVYAQFGFVIHDTGHWQIFRSRRASHVVGLLYGNLATGLAFGWWVDKHHRHHTHPNQEGLDPDVTGGLLAFTQAQAVSRQGLGRFIARHQAVLLFPLFLLLTLDLRISGLTGLARRGYRNRWLEASLYALHLAAYVTAVLLVLSPLKALVFVVVHHGLLGLYLGAVFAPNHKGMPILSKDDNTDFLRRQVLTSRNIRGGWLTDVLLGGLNYQIEHHLFPQMPRPSLRRAQPIVRAYCVSHDVSYLETGLIDSYRQTLHHLSEVGRGELDQDCQAA